MILPLFMKMFRAWSVNCFLKFLGAKLQKGGVNSTQSVYLLCIGVMTGKRQHVIVYIENWFWYTKKSGIKFEHFFLENIYWFVLIKFNNLVVALYVYSSQKFFFKLLILILRALTFTTEKILAIHTVNCLKQTQAN